MHCELASETNPINVLRYNQIDRKTLLSYKLNYFIKQRVIFLIRATLKENMYISGSYAP